MRVSASQLLYGFFIKYDKLEDLTLLSFKDSTAEVVNVYIDMHSMVKILYSSIDYSIDDYNVIASCVINLCAHIRAYYRSRHHVETRIYIVYSENRGTSQQTFLNSYACGWNKTINSRQDVTRWINYNLEILTILCPYLNDIFFIQTSNEPAVAMYNRIMKDSYLYNLPSIVISKDEFCWQLPAMIPNTVLFRPLKKNGNDYSFPISSATVLSVFTEQEDGDNDTSVEGLDSKLFSLFMTFNHCPSRGIKACYNSHKTASIIKEHIASGELINGYNFYMSMTRLLLNLSCNGYNRSGADFLLEDRFRAIDIVFQDSLYELTTECKNESYLIRKIDNDSVRAINDRYFAKFPLDLNRL